MASRPRPWRHTAVAQEPSPYSYPYQFCSLERCLQHLQICKFAILSNVGHGVLSDTVSLLCTNGFCPAQGLWVASPRPSSHLVVQFANLQILHTASRAVTLHLCMDGILILENQNTVARRPSPCSSSIVQGTKCKTCNFAKLANVGHTVLALLIHTH